MEGLSLAGLCADQFPEPPSANHARFVLIPLGAGPVRLQADPAAVAIAFQGRKLSFPIHGAFAQRTPLRRVVRDEAVLGVNMGDLGRRNPAVPLGERALTGDQGVRRVPDHLQIGVVQHLENSRRFGARTEMAGVFVLDPDDHAVSGGLLRQAVQRLDDPAETLFRPHRPPERKDTDNAGPRGRRDLEGAGCQAWLVGKRVLRSELVLLEPRIHLGRIRQNAFQERRCNRDDLQPLAADNADRPLEFLIRQVEDIPAEHHPQFGSGHADFSHGSHRGLDIRRELVGDGGDTKALTHRSPIIEGGSATIALMPEIASSVEAVPHSRIRELAEIAMTMDGVLRLYFGESNLPTPDYIKQAAMRAMAEGYTFYTENAGLPSLRQAIAGNYRRLHGVELDPLGEIVVTASGVQALNVGIRCVLDPGDEALVADPRLAQRLVEHPDG